MTDIVIDTNTWLDWLVFNDPCVAQLRRAVTDGSVMPWATARTRAELTDVLQRPQFAARLPDPLRALHDYDQLICLAPEPPPCGLVCRDPDDQVFIDLAVTRGAGWLLTKDKALLALARAARRRFGLLVLVPSAFAGPATMTPGL